MKETAKIAQAVPGKITRIRHPLNSLQGVIAETTRVYRAMRGGKIDHSEGRSLVWVLSALRAMLETAVLERMEARLTAIEEGRIGDGFAPCDQPALTAT